MAKRKEYQACLAVPPGETLAEVLEDRGMPQNELALRTGVTSKHINEMIQGKAAISPTMALRLEQVLGIEASFWNNLEADYQATLARLALQESMAEEIELASHYDYAAMANAGYVPKTRVIKEKVPNLQRFFGVSSLKYVRNLIGAAFRKGDTATQTASPYALAAWIRKCEVSAQEICTAEFDRDKILAWLPEFRRMTKLEPDEFLPALSKACADSGIALVIETHLPKTYANGVSKWLNSKKAMIALSLRGAYADIFWFTFFHEIGHLVMGHSKKETFINFYKQDTEDTQEQEANRFAADRLIPPAEYKKFITTSPAIEQISVFAEHLGIDQGILAGRLCNDDVYQWRQLSSLRKKYAA
ncbi:MAG: HigA family addiction module antitoxin [Veillonellales bacterium]